MSTIYNETENELLRCCAPFVTKVFLLKLLAVVSDRKYASADSFGKICHLKGFGKKKDSIETAKKMVIDSPIFTDEQISLLLDEFEIESAKYNYRRDEHLNTPTPEPIDDSLPNDFENKKQFTESGNEAEWIGQSLDRITSLDEAIAFFKIDTDIWKVEGYTANAWEMGYVTNGVANAKPLYQIKVRLIRRVPTVHEWPIFQPMTTTFKAPKRKGIRQTDTCKTIFTSDWHVGFRRDIMTGALEPMHDREAIDILCQVVECEKPDTVVLGGDILDLAEWSDKFSKGPEFYWTTFPALVEVHYYIRRLRDTGAEVKVMEGNHENRLYKLIINNLLAAYQIKPVNQPEDTPQAMSIPSLLALKDLGVEWIGQYPNGKYWINDKIRCVHGDISRQWSGKTAAEIVKNSRCSEVAGHCHRNEHATLTVHPRQGVREYAVWTVGTLCRLGSKGPPKAGSDSKQNWQQSFAIIESERKPDGLFIVQPVSIYGGRAFFDGRTFVGKSCVPELNASLKTKSYQWKFTEATMDEL